MDNLNELSKPVAQAYYDEHDSSTMLIDWLVDSVPGAPTTLYSQEYVSALDGVAQFWIGESAGWKKRAEDAEKHITELEAIRVDASQVFKEIGNELGCNPDNESIMMAIDEMKKRLATPKPPEKCPTCNRRYTLESYAHGECAICGEVFDADHALRFMGFTVEGDE